jgi:hypothetical protein
MLQHSASSALGLSGAPLIRRSASVLGLFSNRPLRSTAYRCVIVCSCQCFLCVVAHMVMTAPSLGDSGARPLQSSAYRRPIRRSATLEFGCSVVSSSYALVHFLFPYFFSLVAWLNSVSTHDIGALCVRRMISALAQNLPHHRLHSYSSHIAFPSFAHLLCAELDFPGARPIRYYAALEVNYSGVQPPWVSALGLCGV